MPSLIPTDPTPVKPRVETPHKQLKMGLYLMSWGGYEVTVRVSTRTGTPCFQVPTGFSHPVSTVPDAKFYRLPNQLQ